MSLEYILNPINSRFTVFPIKHHNLWELYKKQQAAFWKAEEIDFSLDREDFEKLNDNEKLFIKMILAFFASSDGIVNFNLRERFLKEIQIMEAQIAYSWQMMMENIHGEVYSLMLDNVISDKDERENLFNALQTVNSVKLMGDWALKWVKSDKNIGCRVVAYCVVEGIMFQGTFAAIFWLKKYKASGKLFMPGLTGSNELISRDEGMHKDFGVEIFKMIENKPKKEEIYEIIKEGVEIAEKFSVESLPCKLIGMNQENMCSYIKYVADRLLVELGYEKLWGAKNPFPFMETIGCVVKTNFFEQRVTEYQSAHTISKPKNVLELTDDF
jgi:ribonucleotide reductase beta subunit family protein with ferritin-like domain